jgi:putative tricarboxylic transport membrane protein
MDTLSFLILGFQKAFDPINLLFCAIGSIAGTLVGILPGIGPTAGIAILLPLTAKLPPAPAIIMLAGIYYGAMYGGSTTAILINIPGEASSVPTTLDGYQLARQGKPGVALAIAAIGSFVAGTLGIVGLTFFAPPLARAALLFGPPEYFALMMLALSVVIGLAGKSLVKGLVSAILGFIVAFIGLDPISGDKRLTFGSLQLMSGIDFISVIVGLFAFAEVFSNVEEIQKSVYVEKIGRLMPTLKELGQSLWAILRGGLIGFLLGLLPGSTPSASAFLAYDFERRVSKHPERFGKGALEGVAAPESANNATSSANFIPLMALGIPSSPPLAVLIGGLMMYGLQPGPLLFKQHADFAWAVIASMYIGNVMLLILNLPLVGLWAKMIRIPYHFLATLIIIFSFIGSYSIRNSLFDVWVALAFGVIGYFMRKFDYPATPLVLCLILAPIVESSFLQALDMSRGDPAIFVCRPFALVLLILALASITVAIVARIKASKSVEAMLSDSE